MSDVVPFPGVAAWYYRAVIKRLDRLEDVPYLMPARARARARVSEMMVHERNRAIKRAGWNIKAVNDTYKGTLIRPMMLICRDKIYRRCVLTWSVGVKVKADFAARG